jgi:hypothetical protein
MPHPQSRRAKERKAKRAKTRAHADVQAEERKRQERAERQEQQHRQQARRRRVGRTRNAVAGGLVVAGLAYGLWLLVRPDPELAGVTRPPYAGQGHVQGATYDSATPTSGPHDPRSPRCGIYREALDPALAVHGLEHGAVVLWYDASRPELVETLAEATRAFDSHVIIAPNARLDAPVVATAWNRLKAYEPDDAEITEFVDTYRQRGPEREPCDL